MSVPSIVPGDSPSDSSLEPPEASEPCADTQDVHSDERMDGGQASGTFRIINRLGLHARAAAKLVRLAGTFPAHIELEKDGQRADAKSVMGVLLLCGEPGSELTVHAEGADAQEAVEAIGALIADRFGESA